MLLYELAIDLDVRSPDLVDAARELGMGELQAGSDIDAQQVAALRARFGVMAPPVLTPPAGPGPAGSAKTSSGGRFRRKREAADEPPPPPAAPPVSGATAGSGGRGGPVSWGPPSTSTTPPAPAPAASGTPAASAAPPASAGGSLGSPVVWGPPSSPAPVADAWQAAPAPPASSPPQVAPLPSRPTAADAPASAPAAWGEPVAPEHWGPPPPPPGGARGAAGAAGAGEGLSRGQLALIGAVVVAVIGLFGFMVVNSGTDERRLQEIAEASPASEEVPTTGPDGEALTKKEREDIAKYDAAVAANEERLCSELRVLSNLDIAMGSSIQRAASLEDFKREFAEGSNKTVAAYDELIPLMPDQAEGLRQLRQFTIDFSASVQAASGVEDLQARIATMTQQAASSGVGQAAIALDRFATETCGVSTGNN